ncbi:hypothetical protein DL95DRAFT_16064 [Leptodontidium sp. 2 PMI_412]|nr:hypothetical protein DL95DRAFT_16064 [Leptodontidium sp. 2 PMI_412]
MHQSLHLVLRLGVSAQHTHFAFRLLGLLPQGWKLVVQVWKDKVAQSCLGRPWNTRRSSYQVVGLGNSKGNLVEARDELHSVFFGYRWHNFVNQREVLCRYWLRPSPMGGLDLLLLSKTRLKRLGDEVLLG